MFKLEGNVFNKSVTTFVSLYAEFFWTQVDGVLSRTTPYGKHYGLGASITGEGFITIEDYTAKIPKVRLS